MSGEAAREGEGPAGDRWRVVIYDSPQHGFDYVFRVLEAALGFDGEQCEDVAGRIHCDGYVHVEISDREAGVRAFEQLVAAGPDPTIRGSDGSLVVALERVHGEDVEVVRRGRGTADGFVPLELPDVERFLGAPLASYGVYFDDPPLGPVILLVHGRPVPWWRRPWLLTIVAPLLPFLLLLTPCLPWVDWWPGGWGLREALMVLLSTCLVSTLLLFAAVVGVRTTGWAVVHEQGVEIHGKGVLPQVVYWKDLAGFWDASDVVQLLPPDRIPRPYHAIPTRDGAERAALLQALMARGIQRVPAD